MRPPGRRRDRARRRSRRAPGGPARPRSRTGGGAAPSACSRSAPTRAARTPPARNGSGRGPSARGYGRAPRRSDRACGGEVPRLGSDGHRTGEGRRPRSRYFAEMTSRYGPLILTLAASWGSSYLFIKVGVRDFEPTVLMTLRLLIAGVLLLAFLATTTGGGAALTQVRGAWREGFVFGAINGAIPFTLIAWGETHIDSGVAAIAQASVPIFVALLAIKFNPSQRSSGMRLVGILVGLLGVGVLAGIHPEGGGWAVAGTPAVGVA